MSVSLFFIICLLLSSSKWIFFFMITELQFVFFFISYCIIFSLFFPFRVSFMNQGLFVCFFYSSAQKNAPLTATKCKYIPLQVLKHVTDFK